MPFSSDQKKWRAPRPPLTLIIFPKSSDQNSEIAILFSVVEKHYDYVFGDDLLPNSPPWEGLQLTNIDQCLHIVMVIGKCTLGKQTEIITHMRGSPPHNSSLYAKVFLVMSTIYSTAFSDSGVILNELGQNFKI